MPHDEKLDVRQTSERGADFLLCNLLLLGVMRNLSGELIVRLERCHMPHLFLQPPFI